MVALLTLAYWDHFAQVLLFDCYRLGKWLNCITVGVTPCGSAVHMMRVSYTSRASVRGLAGGHQSSQFVPLGYPYLVSGWQIYCLVSRRPYLPPSPCALGQQVIALLSLLSRHPYCL